MKTHRILWAIGILVAVTAIGVGVWWVMQPTKTTTPAINSFAECVKAGNPVQTSYPGVCTTKDGKPFTDPTQQAQSSNTQLHITQWNFVLPLSDLTRDAKYTYTASDDSIYLTTQTLEQDLAQVQGCKAGLHGVTLARAKPGDKDESGKVFTDATLQKRALKIGDYYYYQKQLVEPACVASSQSQAKDIANIRSTLLDDFLHIAD